MGTNYYRIPSVQEMDEKKSKLIEDIKNLDISPSSIVFNFKIVGETFEQISYWDEFTENTSIHLGKRSGGWKFLWNFHDNKYYSNKEELFNWPHPRSVKGVKILAMFRGQSVGLKLAEGFQLLRQSD